MLQISILYRICIKLQYELWARMKLYKNINPMDQYQFPLIQVFFFSSLSHLSNEEKNPDSFSKDQLFNYSKTQGSGIWETSTYAGVELYSITVAVWKSFHKWGTCGNMFIWVFFLCSQDFYLTLTQLWYHSPDIQSIADIYLPVSLPVGKFR